MRAGRPQVITEELAARKRTKILEDLASAGDEGEEKEEDPSVKKDVCDLLSLSICKTYFYFRF